MTYHAVFFTDLSSTVFHTKPLGAYRLASELRSHGYRVLVIDYFGQWLEDYPKLMSLINQIITDDTLLVAYSSTFYNQDINKFQDLKFDSYHSYRKSEENSINDKWPADFKKIQLLNKKIKIINPNIKLIYGGAKANFITRKLTNCDLDYIVKGFGDTMMIDIINALKEKRTPKFSDIQDGVKIINYDSKGQSFNFRNNSCTKFTSDDFIIPGESLPIEISRGCMFKCSFCAFPLLGRSKTDLSYIKDMNVLSNEFRYNYEQFGTTNYIFTDDTFNETTEKLIAVRDAIRQAGVKIRFFAYLRADILARFPEQIDILLDMGLTSSMFGIETFNYESAKAIGKGLHPDRVKQFLIDFKRRAGSQAIAHGSFILGLPHDTPETLERDMEWIFEHTDALDSYYLQPLYISNNDLWGSDIAKNPEKYGYTVGKNKYWQNDKMNSIQANEIANRWLEKSWTEGRQRAGAMTILGLLNLGYDYDTAYNTPINKLPYNEIQQKLKKQWLDYQQKVLTTLGCGSSFSTY